MFQITNGERCNGYCENELAIFEVEDKRGANLERCYENLNSIPPSSVEPERDFSG
jgi:hypothetical protein